MSEELLRIYVAPEMVEELRLRKEALEKEIGYKIKGGFPIVSKICADILKRERLKQKGNVKIEVKKIKGQKKSEIFFV